MTNRRGYIAIPRDLGPDHPKFGALWSDPHDRARAYLDLVSLAAWRPRRQHFPDLGCHVELDVGEVLVSIRFLATRFRWTTKKVRGWLELCKREELLRARRKTRAGTVYVVVPFEAFRPAGAAEGTAKGTTRTHQGQAGGTPRAQNEEVQRIAEELPKPEARGRARDDGGGSDRLEIARGTFISNSLQPGGAFGILPGAKLAELRAQAASAESEEALYELEETCAQLVAALEAQPTAQAQRFS
ncbi:MAG: hypothetical protein AAGN66_05560 [Acidobacteriota bacterium]